MASHSEVIALWHPNSATLRDRKVLEVENLVGVCKIADVETNPAIDHLRDKISLGLQTNGDGKCGAHAVFGSPSTSRELKVPNSAQLIRSIFPNQFAVVQENLNACGKELLSKVTCGVWVNFLTPYFNREPLTSEAAVFIGFLKRDASLLERCRLHFVTNERSREEKDKAKQKLHVESRSFFKADSWCRYLWYWLALLDYHIPGMRSQSAGNN